MLHQPSFLTHFRWEHSGIVSVRNKQPSRTEPSTQSFPPMVTDSARNTCCEFQTKLQLQKEAMPHLPTIRNAPSTTSPFFCFPSLPAPCLFFQHAVQYIQFKSRRPPKMELSIFLKIVWLLP